MDYSQFSTALQQILALTDPTGITVLNSMLPRILEYAELRIYRQFDFLGTRTSDVSALTTPGVRSVVLPTEFIVLEGASIIVPANTLPDAGGTRIPMIRTSRSWLDMTWPNESQVATPNQLQEIYYSLYSEEEPAPSDSSEPSSIPSAIQIGPTPDAAYHIEFTGTFRPAPISAINQTTIISIYFPDIFLIAAAIVAHGYLLRNWAGMSDDPEAPQTWEKQYEALSRDVNIEEMRKKSMSVGTSPYLPTPLAGTPRVGMPSAPPGIR